MTRRGTGMWVAMSVVLLSIVLLSGLFAHVQGSRTLHVLSRTMVGRALEDLAACALTEAVGDIVVNHANEPRAGSIWFEALRPPYDGTWSVERVEPACARELAAEEPYGALVPSISAVSVRLRDCECEATGLARGVLCLEVTVKSERANVERTLECRHPYYVAANVDGVSSGRPFSLGWVVVSRAASLCRGR